LAESRLPDGRTAAVAFAGPIRDPVRNKWVVQFGMIAFTLPHRKHLVSPVCGKDREDPHVNLSCVFRVEIADHL
jgi:hypothetical protein